ncbi:MAG: PEP-CTERM sorting domain-containing protein, partial [Phycisphaerae bacterium]
GTFCIEIQEHINIGSTYNAQANTKAIKGGEAVSDPLDPKTAWLFNQYSTGAIVLGSNADRADFQLAIWKLEDEFTGVLTAQAQTYYDLAAASTWTDIGLIRVLNLGTAADNFQYQDLLVTANENVPEPATIAILCLGGLLLRRKK